MFADHQKLTFIRSVRTFDTVWNIYKERWLIETDVERVSEESEQSRYLDDDDDDDDDKNIDHNNTVYMKIKIRTKRPKLKKNKQQKKIITWNSISKSVLYTSFFLKLYLKRKKENDSTQRKFLTHRTELISKCIHMNNCLFK